MSFHVHRRKEIILRTKQCNQYVLLKSEGILQLVEMGWWSKIDCVHCMR